MYGSLLLGFCLFSCIHSQTPANFEQRTLPEVVHKSTKQGHKTCENPTPICIQWDASMEHVFTGHYQVVWDSAVQKREGRIGPSGIFKCKTERSFFFFQFHMIQKSQIHFLLHWNCQQVLSPNTLGNTKTSGL